MFGIFQALTRYEHSLIGFEQKLLSVKLKYHYSVALLKKLISHYFPQYIKVNNQICTTRRHINIKNSFSVPNLLNA